MKNIQKVAIRSATIYRRAMSAIAKAFESKIFHLQSQRKAFNFEVNKFITREDSMEFKKYPHNPPHLFIDGAIYFITGGILDKRLILHDDENRLDGTPGRQVWWNYWDTCIRWDYDFETRLAYLY